MVPYLYSPNVIVPFHNYRGYSFGQFNGAVGACFVSAVRLPLLIASYTACCGVNLLMHVILIGGLGFCALLARLRVPWAVRSDTSDKAAIHSEGINYRRLEAQYGIGVQMSIGLR